MLPAFIAQPQKFRGDAEMPEWVYFPGLRTLLGFGQGIRETFRDGAIYGVRNMFFLGTDLDAVRPSPIAIADQYRWHYEQKTNVRGFLPTLVIDGTDGERLYRMEEASEGGYALVRATRPKPRTLAASDAFAIGAGKDADGNPAFVLYRRHRTLKESYRNTLAREGEAEFAKWMRMFYDGQLPKRLAQLRHTYAAHIDFYEAKRKMGEPAAQKAARAYATRAVAKQWGLLRPQKKSFKKGRQIPGPDVAPEPPPPPKSVPPTEPLPESIRAIMAEIARSRIGSLSRGECEIIAARVERKGVFGREPKLVTHRISRPKKPFPEVVLLERALEEVARRDATALLHDYALEPVAMFSKNGMRAVPKTAPQPTTPSINP